MSAETMAVLGYSLFSVTPLLLLAGAVSERAIPLICAFVTMIGGVATFIVAMNLAPAEVAV